MSHDFECKGGGDAAAYALGALDAEELSVYRRHLQTCTVCQEDVASLEQLTNVLSISTAQYPTPKALRRRVMTDVRTDARRHRAAREASGRQPATGLRLGGVRVSVKRRSWVGAGAAAAVVLVAVLVGFTVSGSRKATSSTRSFAASVGSADVYVSAGKGELVVHKLAQLPETNTYEVWEQRATGSPQSTTLFNTSSTGDDAVNIPGSLQGVKQILVTREAAGGSATPHGKPVVVARLG